MRNSSRIVGCALKAQFLRKRFWTFSVWADEESLGDFVKEKPREEVMRTLIPFMGQTKFVRWKMLGSDAPPSWDDAMAKWRTG